MDYTESKALGRRIMDRIYHSGVNGIKTIYLFAIFPEYAEEVIEDKLRNLAAVGFIKLMFDDKYSITSAIYIPESQRNRS